MKLSQVIATIICLPLILIATGCTDSSSNSPDSQPAEQPTSVPTPEQTNTKNESDFPSDKSEGYTLYIMNNHGNINHEVVVELFDSKNISIFNESYILAPDEKIESESLVGLADGTRIDVTLDNSTTETEFVLEDLSDIAILYIDIDAHHDDPLDLSIAVP